MKLFLKNIIFFAIILCLYFGINYTINYLLIHDKEVNIDVEKTIVLGDSHMVRAINPKYFFGITNISQNSEPYYVSYWKLKRIVKNNKIDTVILGYSYHNLSRFNDYKLSDSKWAKEMFRRCYIIKDFSTLDNIKIDFYSYYSEKFKNMCLNPMNNLTYIGSYQNSNSSSFINLNKTIKRHFHYKSKLNKISINELNHLDKIITLCKLNKIKLILITTPLHETYISKIPNEFLDEFEKYNKKLISQGILVLNYSKVNFDKDEYLNSDHLNTKGSRRFSNMINKALR